MDEVLRDEVFLGVASLCIKTFDKLTTHENQRRTEGIFKQ